MPASLTAPVDVLRQVISALEPLTPEERTRLLHTIETFFDIDTRGTNRTGTYQPLGRSPVPFAEDASITPKEFLLEKRPHTDVERIASLAYYLTHFRDMPKFKTLDLSKLNTEAAQPKFTNAAWATNNALNRGYLAPAGKGFRQLSAVGEQFVRALPDRESARAAMGSRAVKRRSSSKPKR